MFWRVCSLQFKTNKHHEKKITKNKIQKKKPKAWKEIATKYWHNFFCNFQTIRNTSYQKPRSITIKHFFSEFWNVFDICSYLVYMSAFIVQTFFLDETLTLSRRMFTFSLLLMYLKYFEVFLIREATGVKIIMIKKMVNIILLYPQFEDIMVSNISDKKWTICIVIFSWLIYLSSWSLLDFWWLVLVFFITPTSGRTKLCGVGDGLIGLIGDSGPSYTTPTGNSSGRSILEFLMVTSKKDNT